METAVAGVFSCGNVSTVFDLVDYVAQTGMTAGRNAARFATGDWKKERPSVEVIPGENVRVLFPQRYSFQDNLILFIRSAKPIERPLSIDISPLEMHIKKLYARPNEMIRVKVPRDRLKDITESIEVNITER
jgi:hypothetical protein